ncbi:MAG: hypothetical protein AB8B56_19350 [Crocinitomicaceae bacterium]
MPESSKDIQKRIKFLFLIDGIGALLSAFLLGVILVILQPLFGIPISTLYFLAALPCVFAAYDFYCYFGVKSKLGQSLKLIAIVNLLYCLLSLGFAFYHAELMTVLGWVYIVGEILIVATLAFVELKVGSQEND